MMTGIPESLKKRQWVFWTPEMKLSSPLAVDTETDMPPQGVVPNAYRQKMVVLTATDGRMRIVASPHQLGDFVRVHADATWVFHNARFDYWVIQDELDRRGDTDASRLYRKLVEDGKLRCTMILDFLIRLATCKKPDALRMRGLGDFKEYGIVADKHQSVTHEGETFDVRTSFGRFLDKPIDSIPKKMLDYAVWDTVAGYDLYNILAPMAESVGKRNQYGILTDHLQVKADVVLADIGKRGFAVDQQKVDLVTDKMWREIGECVEWFKVNYPLLFDYHGPRARLYTPGSIKIKKDTGLPALKEAGLLTYLGQVMQLRSIPPERIPMTPGSKTKPSHMSLSLTPWQEVARGDEFVDKWCRYSVLTDMHGKVKKLKGQERMYADYRVLKVTGRTSCTGKGGGVNIQSWDRAADMRSLYIAPAGSALVIADYSAIELRTLASVCLDRFGTSKLAEVFRKKIDPHAYTAAMFTGMDPLAFMKMKKSNPDKYKKDRQNAKPINFGVPGGLGPVRLAGYAHAEYGVDITVEQAAELRTKLITVVYPELAKYLRDTTPWVLGRNLHLGDNPDLAAGKVSDCFQPPFPGYWYAVQKIVGFEQAQNMNNENYTERFKQGIWTKLKKLNRNPDLRSYLEKGKPNPMLRRLLFGDTVTTRTGRIRAGVDYGEARNTPFQGAAADGSKVAMWEVFINEEMKRLGFGMVAFIHDEIVMEGPEDKAEEALKLLSQIMIAAMESVVEHNIPIEVEGKVSKVWCK
jgi:hypothetical protein